MDLSSYIDHTNLKSDAASKDIEQLCHEAIENKFKTVCVNPYNVIKCHSLLESSSVKICTVIGFPLGAVFVESKMVEAMSALDEGASEIDMVINIGALKSGLINIVEEEISILARTCRASNAVLKVIIETCLLTEQEKILLCHIVTDQGAHFIKTSTGFSTGGATIEDVKLLKTHVGSTIKVKASGGIRTREQAMAMIEAGAERIGTSAGVLIVKG